LLLYARLFFSPWKAPRLDLLSIVALNPQGSHFRAFRFCDAREIFFSCLSFCTRHMNWRPIVVVVCASEAKGAEMFVDPFLSRTDL